MLEESASGVDALLSGVVVVVVDAPVALRPCVVEEVHLHPTLECLA